MGNIKHIVITLVVSIVLIVGIGFYISYRNGDGLALLESQSLTDDYSNQGPISEVTPAPEDTITSDPDQPNETMDNTATKNPVVTMKTNKGDIVLEMYQDKMPITVGNFVKLAKSGFYDGIKFHRVIDSFMIQGGDPNTKGENTAIYGQGGPGYTIQDEFVSDPKLSNVRGTIAMANTGQPNSGGSQFFINLVDNLGLNFGDDAMPASKHPVFGKVISGMNIVDLIGKVETGDRDMPVEPVVIESVTVQ